MTCFQKPYISDMDSFLWYGILILWCWKPVETSSRTGLSVLSQPPTILQVCCYSLKRESTIWLIPVTYPHKTINYIIMVFLKIKCIPRFHVSILELFCAQLLENSSIPPVFLECPSLYSCREARRESLVFWHTTSIVVFVSLRCPNKATSAWTLSAQWTSTACGWFSELKLKENAQLSWLHSGTLSYECVSRNEIEEKPQNPIC